METLHTCTCPRCAGHKTRMVGDFSSPCLETCRLCNGKGYVDDGLLSPHFAYSELVRARDGFQNDPDEGAMQTLRRLCRDLLEPTRAIVGPLHVTSGYRCQALDASVTQDPRWLHEYSGHSIGGAADTQPLDTGKTLQDIVEAVLSSGARFDQVILEGGCAHLAVVAPVQQLQRSQVLVRMLAPAYEAWLSNHAPGAERPSEFMYVKYSGSPAQLCRIV